MRTIAIGDIHGCLKPLEKMLDCINPEPDDTLVFLGDYVDRGPDSRGVIDCLISLSSRCKTVFLRGNHDMVMQQWCEGFIESELWESIGGATTLASYDFPEPRYFPINHLHFLRRCCNYYETDTHIFVHANYNPDLPINKTGLECLMWTHLGWPIPRPHVSGKTVIVGHTAQTLGLVADFGHLICIDTYCFGGGNLTAYDTGSKTAMQIDLQGNLVRDWNGIPRRGWVHKFVDWLIMPRTKYRRPVRLPNEQPAQCEDSKEDSASVS